MITFIIIALFIIIGGVTMWRGLNHDDEDKGKLKVVKGIIIIILGIVASLIQPYKIERIDAGHKGIFS